MEKLSDIIISYKDNKRVYTRVDCDTGIRITVIRFQGGIQNGSTA